jgi:hypothetical protein
MLEGNSGLVQQGVAQRWSAQAADQAPGWQRRGECPAALLPCGQAARLQGCKAARLCWYPAALPSCGTAALLRCCAGRCAAALLPCCAVALRYCCAAALLFWCALLVHCGTAALRHCGTAATVLRCSAAALLLVLCCTGARCWYTAALLRCCAAAIMPCYHAALLPSTSILLAATCAAATQRTNASTISAHPAATLVPACQPVWHCQYRHHPTRHRLRRFEAAPYSAPPPSAANGLPVGCVRGAHTQRSQCSLDLTRA